MTGWLIDWVIIWLINWSDRQESAISSANSEQLVKGEKKKNFMRTGSQRRTGGGVTGAYPSGALRLGPLFSRYLAKIAYKPCLKYIFFYNQKQFWLKIFYFKLKRLSSRYIFQKKTPLFALVVAWWLRKKYIKIHWNFHFFLIPPSPPDGLKRKIWYFFPWT